MATKGENTIERIVRMAISEFARNGYAGTSISTIAKRAGMNKSSLYTHFESKAELFYVCIREATDIRFEFLSQYMYENKDKPIEEVLYGFLMLYDDLGGDDSDAYFHERFAYFPPEDLKDEVTDFTSNVIIVQVQALLDPVFEKWKKEWGISDEKKMSALIGFLSMYDGLVIERLIGSREKFRYRLEHAWPFYRDGIKAYASHSAGRFANVKNDK